PARRGALARQAGHPLRRGLARQPRLPQPGARAPRRGGGGVSTAESKPRRLGKGLDGLLPAAPPKSAGAPSSAQGFTAPIEDVHPNRAQPRTRCDDAALAELAASIAEMGVLEPILVRKRAKGGFEIIAGERRWRAAQRAGLKQVPVFVRELSTEAA